MARTVRRDVIGLLIEKQVTYTEVELDALIAQAKKLARAEAVKANETGFDQTFCMSASCGSLIHATVGSAGGIGRPANREGLAV